MDGVVRLARIPGKIKKRIWMMEGDIVIVEPWEMQGDERGDVIFKYNPAQVDWLKNRGYLKTAASEF